MSQAQWEEVNFEKASAAYPEIPSTVLVKIEALRRGAKLSAAAQKALQGPNIITPDYRIFSYSSDEPESQATQRVKIPSWFCLRKDDTNIQFRQNSNSPYTVDIRNNRFFFTDDRLGQTPLEEVYFIPQPKSLSRTLPDGTPYERVIHAAGLDKFMFSIRYYCEFWGTGDQCKFCDSGSYLKVKKDRGQKVGSITPQVAAKVIKEVFENEPRFRHFGIGGGTTLDAEKEVDIVCAYLNAIKEAFGGVWYPAYLNIIAREEKYLKKIRETGVPLISLNMEVWDERLFNIICPGKAQLIGREEWIKRAIKGVDIFGRGNVLTDFVAGVEMAQPWGFQDAHSAAKNTLQGLDFLMEHDVLPRFNIFRSQYGAALSGQAAPPLEYYIELFRGFVELVEKHKFIFPRPDRCRACSAPDPVINWWYYFHKEEPALKAAKQTNTQN